MRLLDKYVLKEFLAPFLFGVAAFTAIFLGADTLLKIAGFVSQYGASAISAVKVFILALPRIIVYTFPMAVLLGSLMCFSRLSGASELIVMRTSGQSFFRLALPVFLVAFLISLCAVAFNEYVVPWTNREYDYVVNTEIKKNLNPGVTDHVVIRDVQNGKIAHLLYARRSALLAYAKALRGAAYRGRTVARENLVIRNEHDLFPGAERTDKRIKLIEQPRADDDVIVHRRAHVHRFQFSKPVRHTQNLHETALPI